ncbi:unnamed protein product [Lepeophtheirus salmonis]|uniref:(salmon louse) hypothetical protein n=1 Tax=Lepeophtheirus salmonis TaxID=72036 RepID=A0A7R8CY55_LEPSM|nr:unnamed protein product [Lepeophtheirus salmonis]CAF2967349.1 unnamed protein product [Lepeophtheirus salmonis]
MGQLRSSKIRGWERNGNVLNLNIKEEIASYKTRTVDGYDSVFDEGDPEYSLENVEEISTNLEVVNVGVKATQTHSDLQKKLSEKQEIALKKNLAGKAVRNRIIVDLKSLDSDLAPNIPTAVDLENMIFETLKLDRGIIQKVRACSGYKHLIIIRLKKELDIGIFVTHVEDEFIIRKAEGHYKGLKGSIRPNGETGREIP